MKNAKGGENLNLKAALLLFLVFFASVTTVGIAFSAPTPHVSTATETMAKSESVQLMGDPVDNPTAPC